MPFLVEESWSYYSKRRPFYESSMRTVPVEWKNSEFDDCIYLADRIQLTVRDGRIENNSWNWHIIVEVNDRQIDLLEVCSTLMLKPF